ncbi:MAG: glutathione S-transferase family protein [Polyangiales bacterium]
MVRSSTPVLVTIPISHFCEKARWALDLAGVPYREEPLPPVFHMARTRPSGVGTSTPQLWLGERVIGQSSEIVAYADERKGGGFLLPRDELERAEVERWMALLDEELGPHVRRYAYHHLLDRPDLVFPLMVHGVGAPQRVAFRVAFGPVRTLMRKAMRIEAATAERSRARLRAALDTVGEALADGRPYLVGGRFTAADLTLAALLSPFVDPPSYPVPVIAVEDLPAPLADEVRRTRQHAAGKHARAMYERHRRPAGGAS